MSFVEKLLQNNKHVHIHKDKRESVEKILGGLIKDGRNMLHVVADFDFTLTMYEKDGEILPSTHKVIETNPLVTLPDGSLLGDRSTDLRLKYQPIEFDVNLSIEEKIPYMIEWWHKAHDIILASNLNQNMFQELIYQSNLELKTGVQDFITELLRSETPILIFSAGLGDVIEIFLQKEIPEFKHNHESSHIVSNFIKFGDDGKLLSFEDKLIHSFNKNEHEIHDTPYFQSIHNRPNVILLGDTLGDIGMIGGMKNLEQILKIGFLNRSTPEKLEVYKSVYDIVICDDQTFDVPNILLNAIV